MLVYGDVETTRDAAVFRAEIVAALASLATQPPGLDRHSALVTAFLDAGDLVGALIDRDAPHELSTAATTGMAALTALARAVDLSWRSDFVALDDLPIDLLNSLPATGTIRIKPAEGYAFYGLYPESYAETARRSGLPPETRVIGIRSMGTTLAAMVAAGLHAAPPVTVRPVGHPFDRHLEPGPALADAILAGDPPAFAIVDEGPGLSGSSFTAVMDWLAGNGIPPGRIHLFPSHANGPGAQASEARRRQWQAARKHLVSFDELIAPRLERWVADLVGPLDAPLSDLSGGQWQGLAGSTAPVAPSWEKRKYLAETGAGRWLVKFAGLGSIATRKLDLATRLHAAGFAPEPAGLCYGFLVERWIAAPSLADAQLPMTSLMPQLAAYPALRATLAAPSDAGATPERLTEMATYNTAQALGDVAGAAMSRRLARSPSVLRRVWVDARLHPWEWLIDGDRLIKTDALDHALAHDFIGCQPIEWDLAGAIVEHGLAAEAMTTTFEAASGQAVDRSLLDFMTCCYLAFQLGAWTMATGRDAPITRRYRERLAEELGV
ncbi:MAG TPA: hypothetical protein VIN06_17390 [Devosia sp.]